MVIKAVRASVLEPLALVAVNVTVYVPGVKYVVEGFFKVDVEPLPKFHCHAVGLPVERSWKLMMMGAQPLVCAAVKFAVGVCAHPDKQITKVSSNKVSCFKRFGLYPFSKDSRSKEKLPFSCPGNLRFNTY